MKFSGSDAFWIIALAASGKMLSVGLTAADAAGVGLVLASIIAKPVAEYLYPKRPDLFREVHELSLALKAQQETLDSQQRELTALKFGAVKR